MFQWSAKGRLFWRDPIYHGSTPSKQTGLVNYQNSATLLYDFIGHVMHIIAELRKLLSMCRSVVNPVNVPRNDTKMYTKTINSTTIHWLTITLTIQKLWSPIKVVHLTLATLRMGSFITQPVKNLKCVSLLVPETFKGSKSIKKWVTWHDQTRQKWYISPICSEAPPRGRIYTKFGTGIVSRT